MKAQAARSTQLAARVRRDIVEQSHRANVGHIGSALSIADLLAALFCGWLRLDGDDRDRFTLSKGHAALALYAALEATGRLPAGSVQTYCADDTLLGVHPDVDLDGIDFSTGSLGQGLSMATGAALAAKLQGSGRRSVVVSSLEASRIEELGTGLVMLSGPPEEFIPQHLQGQPLIAVAVWRAADGRWVEAALNVLVVLALGVRPAVRARREGALLSRRRAPTSPH